jgi:hypothetical protein
VRVPEERYVKKMCKWKLIASRPVGRPNFRWMDNVMKDIQAMEIVNWKSVHRIEIKWKLIVSRPKLI